MKSFGLIPRKRLRNLPVPHRALHEFCFFLHDECVRILKEYEAAKAHLVDIKFEDKEVLKEFERIAEETDTLEAMEKLGYRGESNKVILNTITVAMTSDCLHHIYEALICFEKRKFVVGFNLLRKPLLDSLMYLTWILYDEDSFLESFLKGEPEKLAQHRLGNHRVDMFKKCLELNDLNGLIDELELNDILFKKTNGGGLYMLFQHAVHLITLQHIELKSTPQNFNFIFKNPLSDDVYENLYDCLPHVMLYLSHVIINLYDKIKPMDKGAKTAFYTRSVMGFMVVIQNASWESFETFQNLLSKVSCEHCKQPFKHTSYNLHRVVLNESFRCSHCGKINHFPFSWIF